MLEKIRCWKCNNETYRQENCIHCGASLLDYQKVGEDLAKRAAMEKAHQAHQDGFLQRYYKMYRGLQLADQELVRFSAFRDLRDSPWPGLKRFTVPKGWKAIVYNQRGGVETELPPGTYTSSKTKIGSDPLAGLLDRFRGTQLSIFMYRAHEFPITYMVPEATLEDEHGRVVYSGPYEDLASCNIRSADGLVGGAYLTMVMRIEKAERLLETLGEADEQPKASRSRRSFKDFLLDPFGQSQVEKDELGTTHIEQFNALYLWKRIRSEFVMIISSAVANENVLPMRHSLEVRDRVLKAISSAMTNTLNRFGLQLVEVTSFRFLSPEDDNIQVDEARLAQEEAELRLRQRAAAIRQQTNALTAQASADAAATAAKIEKADIAEQQSVERLRLEEERTTGLKQAEIQAALDKARDANNAASAARAREQKALELELERDQHLRDEQARLQLFEKKARMALALKNEMLAAENDRRIKYLEAIKAAGLPPESILAIQLAENPELAQAYAEAVRARGLEERLKLQKEFEEKLIAMNTTDRAQVHELLTVGIKQIGAVMVAAQDKQRPQVVATGNTIREIVSGPAPSDAKEDR